MTICEKCGDERQNLIFPIDNIQFKMIYIQGGTFIMGASAEQGEDASGYAKPAHPVTLSDFWIGEVPVTQSLWKTIMGNNPSHFKGEINPVENVSYREIVKEFLPMLNKRLSPLPEKMKFRLPTEAEWEFAARGGTKSKGYKYAGSNVIDEVAWNWDNCNSPQPVGQKRPNELGLYDMSGNVWEWCKDPGGFYKYFCFEQPINPVGIPQGAGNIYRGGSWFGSEEFCRVSYRYYASPQSHTINRGFRVVLTA